jgi:putative SOS response-associated peptidase YedK
MCGRFHISTSPGDIAREFSIRREPNFHPWWNAATTNKLQVVATVRTEPLPQRFDVLAVLAGRRASRRKIAEATLR